MLSASSGGVANCPHLLRSCAVLRLSRRACSCWRRSSISCVATAFMGYSNPELVDVLDPMLPDPVYTLCGFVAQISGVKVATEEKEKNHLFAVSGFQLSDFYGLFLPAFVDVCEVTCGFRLDEQGHARKSGAFGLDDRIDRYLDVLRIGLGAFHVDIQAEGERARLHLREWRAGGMPLQFV